MDEGVGGFDVTVDDALAMCGIESFGDIDGDAEKRFGFDWPPGDTIL
jgi:hypothetical protein